MYSQDYFVQKRSLVFYVSIESFYGELKDEQGVNNEGRRGYLSGVGCYYGEPLRVGQPTAQSGF